MAEAIHNLLSSITNSNSKCEIDLCHLWVAHMTAEDLTLAHKHASCLLNLSLLFAPHRACYHRKAHILPLHDPFQVSEHLGELVHSDILGQLEMSYLDRYKYAFTFIHEY